MREFAENLVMGIMDAFEEFFSALTSPTTKFTFDAFLVSLGFLIISILTEVFGIFGFVNWKEAATTSVIMLCIVLIDSTTRISIKQNVQKVLTLKDRFSNNRNCEVETEEEIEDESGE